MSRVFPIAMAAMIIITTGVLHGRWTNRWTVDAALKAAAARLSDIPTTIGEWESEEQPIDPEVLKRSQAHAIISRKFTNHTNGRVISALLVCGRPGNVAVHTPDICFQGAGRQIVDNPTKHTASIPSADEASSAEFFTADFASTDQASPGWQRVFWSWAAEGSWQAPDHPRFEFVKYPVLFKLYLVRQTPPLKTPVDGDPCIEFAKELIPVLNTALFEKREPSEPDS